MLDYIITGMILDEKLTGYDIKKEIEFSVGHFCKVSYGNLYPTLKKLTEKGLLTMREQPRGERMKKYYIATEAGRARFIEWLSAPIDFESETNHLLLKAFFYDALPPEVSRQRLYECELYVRQGVMKLEALEKELEDEISSGEHYYRCAILYFGLQNAYESIRWLKYVAEKKPLKNYIRGE